MRLLTSCLSPVAALALLAAPLAGFAADAAPSSAPPKLERLDEGPDSGVTIRKPESQRKITEKKVGGKVTEIQVKSGKSRYVMKPNDAMGSVVPGEKQSNQVRGAQWSVMEFDLGQKKTGDKDAKEDASLPPAPNAAPAASGKSSK